MSSTEHRIHLIEEPPRKNRNLLDNFNIEMMRSISSEIDVLRAKKKTSNRRSDTQFILP